ncbi:MAG: phospholipase D-like domain-containing protein [Patescibacteria group bacterium]
MATTWKFYLTSDEAWDAMYADCQSARETIDIEQFIMQYEPATKRFFELFMDKARSGVRVRVLCDMVGSYQIYESPVIRDLQDAGIEVQFVHPVSAWRVPNWTSWAFRDHRKLLVIDGTIAHTGGVGLNQKTKAWRDTNIRLTGPVVDQMQRAYDQMWQSVKEDKPIRSRQSREFVEGFTFLTDTPWFRSRLFYQNLLGTIKHAQRSIYLTTPYFVPPLRLFRRLRQAARRGIEVRLLLPMSSDFRIVDYAMQSFFTLALKSGIKIYRYRAGMMHAKVGVIDEEWATVGSTNLDNLSFLFNHEANIVTMRGECIEELKRHFFEDLENAEEVRFETWTRRFLGWKILELLTWPIHSFL